MKRYIVVEHWVESYQNPIFLKKNDRVLVDFSIKETDVEWINWLWCIAENGMTGWVPKQILNMAQDFSNQKQIAFALENYSAYELSVDKGDIIIGTKILNGWIWCQKENTDKNGWIPIRNVKVILD